MASIWITGAHSRPNRQQTRCFTKSIKYLQIYSLQILTMGVPAPTNKTKHMMRWSLHTNSHSTTLQELKFLLMLFHTTTEDSTNLCTRVMIMDFLTSVLALGKKLRLERLRRMNTKIVLLLVIRLIITMTLVVGLGIKIKNSLVISNKLSTHNLTKVLITKHHTLR